MEDNPEDGSPFQARHRDRRLVGGGVKVTICKLFDVIRPIPGAHAHSLPYAS